MAKTTKKVVKKSAKVAKKDTKVVNKSAKVMKKATKVPKAKKENKLILAIERQRLGRPLTVKFSDDAHDAIKKLASQFTNGNVSSWIRYAAANFKPMRKQLKKV